MGGICKFICDGCGKEEMGFWNGQYFVPPPSWFLRADKDGAQIACSRVCVERIADKTGKTSIVMPF